MRALRAGTAAVASLLAAAALLRLGASDGLLADGGAIATGRGQGKWRADWDRPEDRDDSGGVAGASVHGRGFIQVRGGLCMHVPRGVGGRPIVGTCGAARRSRPGLAQQWQLEEGSGLIRHESAGCLDGGGGQLNVWECDASNANQHWRYDAARGVLTHITTGLCLDAPSPSNEGALIELRSCKPGVVHQEWDLGVRVGQWQMANGGACLWALSEMVGEVVSARGCGNHTNTHWLWNPRAGVLNLHRTELCLEIVGTHVLRLAHCSVRGPWIYDPSTGYLRRRPLAGAAWEPRRCLRVAEGGPTELSPCSPDDARGHVFGVFRKLSQSNDGGGAPREAHATGAHGAAHDSAQGIVQGGAHHEGHSDVPGGRVSSWRIGVLTGQVHHRHGICLQERDSRVVLWACELGALQQWTYDETAFHLRHLGSGRCLERHGGSVRTSACRGTKHLGQRWSYESSAGKLRHHGGLCLEAKNSNAAGSPVVLANCDSGGSGWRQEWDLAGRGANTELLTVETRNAAPMIALHGLPGRTLHNVGIGGSWHGFVTKVRHYKEAVDVRAGRSPEDLVVLTDSDVAYGGCGEANLLGMYRKIVSASGGAPVVVSADANQYPPIDQGLARFRAPHFAARRKAVMSAFGLDVHALDPFFAQPVVPGAVPIAIDYAFVNSGFIMGPAREVSAVLQCMLDEGWDKECVDSANRHGDPKLTPRKVAGVGKQTCFDDQRALSICALKNPSKITVDYTGNLMMTTYGLHNMFKVTPEAVINTITGARQCFIHANCWDWTQPEKWDAWVASLARTYAGAK